MEKEVPAGYTADSTETIVDLSEGSVDIVNKKVEEVKDEFIEPTTGSETAEVSSREESLWTADKVPFLADPKACLPSGRAGFVLTLRHTRPYNETVMEILSRTEKLLGAEAMKKLAACRVAIFGLGGVGGHAMEALVRSGIGAVDIIDHDRVDETNINRQIIATQDTIGAFKVDAAADRIEKIDPRCRVRKHCSFFLPENKGDFDFTEYDYVIDAIDTVAGKLALIEAAREAGVPIISSMGAGNKLDASAFKVADIYDT